jgi:hypothetical protein
MKPGHLIQPLTADDKERRQLLAAPPSSYRIGRAVRLWGLPGLWAVTAYSARRLHLWVQAADLAATAITDAITRDPAAVRPLVKEHLGQFILVHSHDLKAATR